MKPDRNFRWVSGDDFFTLFVHDLPRAQINIEWGKPRVYIQIAPGGVGVPIGPAFPTLDDATKALRDWFGNPRIPAPKA